MLKKRSQTTKVMVQKTFGKISRNFCLSLLDPISPSHGTVKLSSLTSPHYLHIKRDYRIYIDKKKRSKPYSSQFTSQVPLTKVNVCVKRKFPLYTRTN